MWPQVTFIFSYINCDSLALLGVASIMLFWLRGIKYNWRVKECIGLTMGMSITVLSYKNAYPFVVLSVMVYVLSCVKKRRQEKWLRNMMLKGALIAFITVALSGWFYIRNYNLYGDFLGNDVKNQMSNLYAVKEFSADYLARNGKNMMTTIKGIGGYFRLSAFSYIGMFGWMNIAYSKIFYYLETFLIGITFIVGITSLPKSELFKKNKLFFAASTISSFMVILLAISYQFFDYQPQGRYWLPTIITVVMIMIIGFHNFVGKMNISNQFEKKLIVGNLSVLFVVNMYSCLVMIPYA